MKILSLLLAVLTLLLFSPMVGLLAAADTAEAATAKGVHSLDFVVLGLYVIGTIYLGYYISKRQKNRDDYFTGGGNMSPLLIGVSLFATLLSTISYLGLPGEAAGKGPVTFIGYLAHPLIFLLVGFLMLPYYMKHKVTSAYELLEMRLGYSFRVLGACLFLTLRLIWMAVLLHFAGEAMVTMLDVDHKWITLVVAIIGLVAIIYTSMGGLQAVVITDLMQTLLLYGGAITVLAVVTINFGGFSWIPTQWPSDWKPQPVLPEGLSTRVSWVGSLITTLVWYVATLCSDQTSVQRFMATKDATTARKALLYQLGLSIIVAGTLCLVGIALMAHYQKEKAALPAQQTANINMYSDLNTSFQIANKRFPNDAEIQSELQWDAAKLKQTRRDLIGSDQWFPRFISQEIPIGLTGLVIAAMFAAAMSSLDSGVNSITAVVMSDFVERLRKNKLSDKHHLKIARLIAIGVGVVVVLGSGLTEYIEGNIIAVTQKSVNLLTTPIFGLFFYAIFAKRVHPAGVWAGTIAGTLTAILTAFSGQICYWLYLNHGFDPTAIGGVIAQSIDDSTGIPFEYCTDPVSFQWIGPFALSANLAVGMTVSYLLPKWSRPDTTTNDS
ncbi:MAG TPA: sodium-coupled permease [Planctomycetaceae bacterium]|nr:sodium-coupled permease [Planctomycetaceae bacterium]